MDKVSWFSSWSVCVQLNIHEYILEYMYNHSMFLSAACRIAYVDHNYLDSFLKWNLVLWYREKTAVIASCRCQPTGSTSMTHQKLLASFPFFFQKHISLVCAVLYLCSLIRNHTLFLVSEPAVPWAASESEHQMLQLLQKYKRNKVNFVGQRSPCPEYSFCQITWKMFSSLNWRAQLCSPVQIRPLREEAFCL